MTRAQALAMLDAMASVQMPGQIVLSFPPGLGASYQVQMSVDRVYDGSELNLIADYCNANGLDLTAQFETFGVV